MRMCAGIQLNRGGLGTRTVQECFRYAEYNKCWLRHSDNHAILLLHSLLPRLLGRGVSPLPTGYDWHGDAPLVSLDSDEFRPVVET